MENAQQLSFFRVKKTQYDGAGYFSDLDDASTYKTASRGITETHFVYAAFDYHLCTIEYVVFTKHTNNPKNPVRIIGHDWNLLYTQDEEGIFRHFDLREELEEYLVNELGIIPIYVANRTGEVINAANELDMKGGE